MIRDILTQDLKEVIEELGFKKVSDIVLSIPRNLVFGEYSSNIALQLSKEKSKYSNHSPLNIANDINLKISKKNYLSRVEVAGPGFLNFYIKDEVLLQNLKSNLTTYKKTKGRKILVEYGNANILKEVHIGHLRTFILGESLSRILTFTGNDVFRANYQGDIGLHVAKALWGVQKLGIPKNRLNLEEKAEFLGRAYALGNTNYEADQEAKKEIDQLNNELYKNNSSVEDLYQKMKQWSIDYFDQFYKLMGIKYDRCFFESETYKIGKEIVLNNLETIFQKSEGAIIFPGEKYGLHNRVFINSAGNPTYEAKEVGLADIEYKEFPYDLSIHIVGSEQAGYFAVVFKVLEMLFDNLRNKKYHLLYGMIDLKAGKMSSRTGNVVTIDDLFRIVSKQVRKVMSESRLEINDQVAQQVVLGSIKFSYLKFSPSSNIIFDVEKSVSLQGDSGPYLQYTYARIQSVLKNTSNNTDNLVKEGLVIEKEERALLARLEYYAFIVESAASEYRPNLLCEYLLDLAKDFNTFYQKYRIINSEKEKFRLVLTKTVGDVLKSGLSLLSIESPEKM